ncbi:MAG: GIY-YIG nuclease family protein [Candidatus Magasanikbacteria bacterium]|nr:GIY-YIG nuclease family protein [Candidatus Magasanikbacteria bacterium]
MRKMYVYILSNTRRTVYYVGVTNFLQRRLSEHRNRLHKNSFTDRYNCVQLIYYEKYDSPMEAIRREKELKKWRREKKLLLVKRVNPGLKSVRCPVLR